MVGVSDYGYTKNFSSDAYNLRRERNEDNTLSYWYNCGGFALGTFSWYYPYDNDLLDYAYNNNLIDDRIYNRILGYITFEAYEEDKEHFLKEYDENDNDTYCYTLATYDAWVSLIIEEELEFHDQHLFRANSKYMDYYINKILQEITGLRRIANLKDVKENEYCVAFRVGHGDFHFIRSENNKCNVWLSKGGHSRIKRLEMDGLSFGARANTEDFFDELFGDRYDSETILFAKTI